MGRRRIILWECWGRVALTESRSMLMIKNGIKIYADEMMGLLDEKGLEAVAMTTRGNFNNKEWLLW